MSLYYLFSFFDFWPSGSNSLQGNVHMAKNLIGSRINRSFAPPGSVLTPGTCCHVSFHQLINIRNAERTRWNGKIIWKLCFVCSTWQPVIRIFYTDYFLILQQALTYFRAINNKAKLIMFCPLFTTSLPLNVLGKISSSNNDKRWSHFILRVLNLAWVHWKLHLYYCFYKQFY